MTDLSRFYQDAINQQLSPYIGNWMPDRGVDLGSVLEHKNNVLSSHTSIDQLGINFVKSSTATKSVVFTAGEGTTYNVSADATGVEGLTPLSANIAIKFCTKGGVFFSAVGCNHEQIDELKSVYKKILALANAGKWQEEWIVIVEMIRAKTLNVIISQSTDASLSLSANGPIDELNTELTVQSQSGSVFNCAGAKDAVPCFVAMRVKSSFFSRGKTIEVVKRAFDQSAEIDDAEIEISQEEDIVGYFEPVKLD